MDDQFFIGVDGGGSGCRAVIATATRVVGKGRGGPANVSSDSAGAITSVRAALEQARVAAGITNLSGAVIHLGLAGVLTPEHAQIVAAVTPSSKVAVTDDRPTMIAGALGDGSGIVAAIGTGSFIGSKRGTTCQFIGGWGPVLGDEASGAWLGRSALAETLKALEGMGEETALTREILTHFDGDPNAVVAFAATATPSGFGRFVPRVSAAAQEGDTMGLALMQRGAGYVGAALRALNHRTNETFCLTGGLGPAYAPFLPDHIAKCLTPPKGTALDGALALARAMG